ncbi:MAG: hypothetical protein Ct9H90mP11_04370 [Acidimicrobiales bacterium]|nr:MAG: hypothetical protein Ct9H90mP11_04370 [Acidimicrobiales bacterium]
MGPMQEEWGLSIQHVVCHSMRDAAGILDATAIPTMGDGVVAPNYGQPISIKLAPHPVVKNWVME